MDGKARLEHTRPGNDGRPATAEAETAAGALPFRRYLQRHEMSLETFLRLALRLCAALSRIHREGVILGTLNPDNMLVSLEDDSVYFASSIRTGRPDADPNALCYLAPEQTGRSSRPVDLRTDIFSLGVVLYEALTCRRPVEGKNRLEWFHNLMAGDITPPNEVDPQVPAAISDSVMKCLARDPDKRYQSVEGVRRDLLRCLEEWEQRGSITPFKIGQYDWGDAAVPFKLSDGFFGRERELQLLREAFERARRSPAEAVFVSGQAGIGKTRLVRQFGTRVRTSRGLFMAGKFQSFAREAPYEAVIDAFEQLFQWVEGRGKEEVSAWRELILANLGVNVSLVTALIPYMERLVGKQPEVTPGSSIEARDRLFYALCQLLQLFAARHAPLVLFLDDLHWADPGSLRLVESIVLEHGVRHVLLIGTYREEELPSAHALRETIAAMERKAARFSTISLSPLDCRDVEEATAASLCCSVEEARPLARFLYEKAGGNPLFVGQLLQAMYKKGLIVPKAGGSGRGNSGSGRDGSRDGNSGGGSAGGSGAPGWRWDLRQIEQTEIASDMAGFLAERIALLPRASRDMLRLAACVGSTFDVPLLARASGWPEPVVEKRLGDCIAEGLAQRLEGRAYGFVHDRVHHAAYLLTPGQERKAIHHRLGRLMLEGMGGPPEAPEAVEAGEDLGRATPNLFAAVNHLNLGLELLVERAERIGVAGLNLLAGKRAKQASAFAAALRYLESGLGLLDKSSWETDYRLTFELNLEHLECQYLCGHYDEAERLFHELLGRARDRLDRTRLRVVAILFATKNDFDSRAIRVGLDGLEELGHGLPAKPSALYLVRQLLKVKRLIRRTGIHRIMDLPPAQDEEVKAASTLLYAISPCAYNNSGDLLFAIALKSCELSLRFGHSTSSSPGYMMLAAVCVVRLKDYRIGVPLREIALDLAKRYGTPVEEYVVDFLYGAFLLPWLDHTRHGELYQDRAKESSLACRDLTYAGYAMTFSLISKHFRGVPLHELADQIREDLLLAPRVRDPYFACFLTIYRQMVLALQGLTREPGSFSDDAFDEEGFIRGDTGYKIREKELFDYYLCKNQVLYLNGDYERALPLLKEAERLTRLYFGEVYLADHAFYYCLTVTAMYHTLSIAQRAAYWPLLQRKRRQMAQWSRRCPANFEHKRLLIEAEMARIRRRNARAALLYDRAIRSARAHGFIQNAAIASECAARFYLSMGLMGPAEKCMKDAYEGYRTWGAWAKAEQLRSRYPWLAGKEDSAPATSWAGALSPLACRSLSQTRSLSQMVDMEAIFQAAQHLSSEIILEDLLRKMMETVVQDAGASRGTLLLPRDGRLYVEAHVETGAPAEAGPRQSLVPADGEPGFRRGQGETRVLQSIPLEECDFLPRSVINHAARTGETVVLDNAARSESFAGDSYIASRLTPSVLCLPIIGKGKTVGVLYLENSTSAGVFTPERVEVLRLLSSQIAISIENARLYADLQQSRDRLSQWNQMLEQTVAERTRQLQHANEQLMKARDAACAANRAKSDFLAVMGHEIRTPMYGVIGAAELLLQTPLDQEQREYASAIADASELLLTVINDVLDISKIEEGKLQLQSVNFHVPTIGKSILASVAPRARSKGIALRCHVAPEIPATLRGDPMRLSQVLLNLMSNAVEFTEQGEVTLRVLMEGEEPNRVTLRFEVRDTGIGIPEQAQALLFQPFYQVDSAIGRKHSRGGTGLGLAICKRLTDLMGGRIGFESAVGRGSTFWFAVPLLRARAEVEPGESGVAEHAEGHAAAGLASTQLDARLKGRDRSGTVLVAEDNVINQRLIVSQLGKLGLSADVACNGKEAVEAYARARYVLVLMDCQMPVMDGYEAAMAIRRLEAAAGAGGRRTPIIGATAGVMSGEEERCLAAGMDDFLSKPIRMRNLQEMLARWLPSAGAGSTGGTGIERGAPRTSAGADGGRVVESFISTFVDDARSGEFREMIGGDAGFLVDLIETFLRDMPTRMAALRQSFDRKDAGALRMHAHGMKSSGHLLGLTEFASLCQQLERSAAAGGSPERAMPAATPAAAGGSGAPATGTGAIDDELVTAMEATYRRLHEKMSGFLKDAREKLMS